MYIVISAKESGTFDKPARRLSFQGIEILPSPRTTGDSKLDPAVAERVSERKRKQGVNFPSVAIDCVLKVHGGVRDNILVEDRIEKDFRFRWQRVVKDNGTSDIIMAIFKAIHGVPERLNGIERKPSDFPCNCTEGLLDRIYKIRKVLSTKSSSRLPKRNQLGPKVLKSLHAGPYNFAKTLISRSC